MAANKTTIKDSIENIDHIRSFVKKALSKEIRSLEKRRLRYHKHARLNLFFIVSIVLHVPIFFIPNKEWGSIAHQITFLFNVVLSYLAFFKFKGDERLYFDYRKSIIPILLAHIDGSFKYYPRAKILAKEFASSGLFYHNISKLVRKDLILGMANKAAFSMSYVKAQTKEFLGRSAYTGATNNTMITNFQGLHYVFKVPYEFYGTTIMLPIAKVKDGEVELINRHNLNVRTKRKGTAKILTGNLEFDSLFAIFTSNEKQARNFFTDQRIKDILAINNLFNKSVGLSFFGSFVFLQARTNQEVFKVDIHKSINVDQVVENYFNLKIALEAVSILMH